MKRNDLFPSKWLKSEEINGERSLTIENITTEDIVDPTTQEKESKPIVWFDETEKGLILNATNFDRIAIQHGNDTDLWLKKKITLHLEPVTAFGKTTRAIRIKI